MVQPYGIIYIKRCIMINWFALVQYVAGLVFNFGLGFAAIVWAIKKLKE